MRRRDENGPLDSLVLFWGFWFFDSLVNQPKHSASQRSASGGQRYAASGSQALHFSSSASKPSGRGTAELLGHPGMVGRWDGGTEARQVFLEPGVPLSRKTIQLLHSCEAPTGPEGEKGPFCVLAFSNPHRDRDGPDKLGGGRHVLGCLPR